ncbi:hydroxyacylglutathione hydrolase [Parvularcula flava]|uniref:Hydroxyacylglutathione hydrolase n=1 Tax=Aquisalinus luteolus TaxID=1566827 RepID=A0A8J3A8C5_9PROT|nr:hydroxyacylglutathione hydrolase [Aquisalinus luteolus]NHK28806.1 hydroxyacylglutathione hydrolase [Aquisalinus luteolus]GGH99573.1 hydroxyacylglutathione hydrolase [Aquisalinus luteolus]
MSFFHQIAGLQISQFPCLSDNYGFLVHDPESHSCAAIDTPDADAVNVALEERGWQLTDIFNTHWHPDHTGGNQALKERWACTVTGPKAEDGRIPVADRLVHEGDTVSLGGFEGRVIDTPGHTRGHIIYHFEAAGMAFVGDTLFALGCGRLFEGTAAVMWPSLKKVRALPEETVVFCAHEYTQSNARFAETVETGNKALMERIAQIDEKRARGEPTVPTTIALERDTNPFLRADIASLQSDIEMSGADPVDVFAEIRQRKDNF